MHGETSLCKTILADIPLGSTTNKRFFLIENLPFHEIENYVMKFHGDTVTPVAKQGLVRRDRGLCSEKDGIDFIYSKCTAI